MQNFIKLIVRAANRSLRNQLASREARKRIEMRKVNPEYEAYETFADLSAVGFLSLRSRQLSIAINFPRAKLQLPDGRVRAFHQGILKRAE